MRVLTLDTAPATNERLRAAEHDVTEVSFGYRDRRGALYAAPYEFDAIVCDLQEPACFDSAARGPNGNENFKCSLIPSKQLTWETRRIGVGTAVSEEQRYKLIQESQIIGMSAPKSPFGPGDVRDAIKKAGVPLIIFLNREWALRTGHIPYDRRRRIRPTVRVVQL
jgi:hypothetical protein